MTKTQARKIAQQARRYGHYVRGAELEVTCPQCRAPIRTQQGYRWRLARKGEPANVDPEVLGGRRAVYERESVVQALDSAMITHLLDCPGQ